MTNTETTATETFAIDSATYGIYTKDGMDYTLVQLPYIDGYDDVVYYSAAGYDRDGNDVKLIWDVVKPDADDNADACDWDMFEVRSN